MKEKLFENVNGNQFKIIKEGSTVLPKKREVKIGMEIMTILNQYERNIPYDASRRISKLVQELMRMHGGAKGLPPRNE